MIPKDASYHRSAVMYNEELAAFAEELSTRLPHEEVARWARSVSKQHKFHAGRHKKALAKLAQNSDTKSVETEDGGEDHIVEDERVVHKSAKDGKFVSAAEADANPDTTFEEHVPVGPGNPEA